MGYLFYGGISFGLTEYLKRRFVELAGPDLAALYPIPILLGARYDTTGGVSAGVLGAAWPCENGWFRNSERGRAKAPEASRRACFNPVAVAKPKPPPLPLSSCCCSAVSACFAATAVTPFETLRIKTVTVPNFPKTLAGAMSEMVSTGRAGDLVAGKRRERGRGLCRQGVIPPLSNRSVGVLLNGAHGISKHGLFDNMTLA